jgi:hypothetical protein
VNPLPANQAAVTHGPYAPKIPVRLGAAEPSTAPKDDRDEYLVSGVDQLDELHIGVIEFGPEQFRGAPQPFGPPLHGRKVGQEQPGGHELELRWRVDDRYRALQVASVEGRQEPPEQLDVLLRHRPRSISPKSAAFHAKRRFSSKANYCDIP